MYKTKIKIKFSDCDAGGRIFFAKLFDYAHAVYEEFILKEFQSFNFFTSDNFIVPIIKASAEYYKPIVLHDEIEVQMKVDSISLHSMVIKYVFIKDDSQLATAETVHVFVNKKTGEKMKIDKRIKSIMLGFIK